MEPPGLEDVQRAVGERYEVLGLVGAGGMGAVFRARHRALGQIVAVKVLPPEVAASQMRRERFRREAQLGASLDHPNIVRVYDFDTTHGITLLIMTFVRGLTLEERLRDTPPPPWEQILRWMREIASALGYAHHRGIVHRDVKPSNILLDEDSGRALLTDFGIARVEGVAESSLTAPGAAIGTPGYMAPEQAMAARVDGRADLYALAAVGFEALTGEAPAFGVQRAGLARTLRAARPELSSHEVEALVAPLAELPDDRPGSADAWLANLAPARPRWSRWVALGGAALVAAGAAWLIRGRASSPATSPRLAVMPFAVLGTPPYPATQLPEYFISRFRPVEQLGEVVSFGRVVAQIGTAPPSNAEAQDVARRLNARFYIRW
jgi:serine/threonine protein kinase